MKNRGVIYTGKVGRRMPIRHRRASRRIIRKQVFLLGGPLHGGKAWIDATSDLCTLPIVCRGQCGRYRDGKWERS